MAADSTHPLYDDCIDAWRMVRDCISGSRKIKEAGETYLPRLHKQLDPEYEAYKFRAVFFNACKRTLQAFVGFVFRNNPEQEVPATMVPFMKDATMTGVSFYDYSKETVRECLSLGKRGTLIDWNLIPENRPFIVPYSAEEIINWKFKRINGRTVLGLLVFKEMSREFIALNPGDAEPDQYEQAEYEQLREYELLVDEQDRPFVQVTVKRKKFAQPAQKRARSAVPQIGEWVVVDQKIPMRGPAPLTRIPFVIHGAEKNDLDTDEVPFESIAAINVSHYCTSADLENALHIAGVPTPIAAGFGGDDEDTEEFYLGTAKAWVTDKADAKAYFLAYDASQAEPLVSSLSRKEAQMASLGARMLEKQGEAGGGRQEAFQTVQARQSGDMSALMSATIANTQSLSDVLQWVAWWMDRSVAQPEDLDETVFTELNTEFIEMLMDSSMLSAVWSVYMGGGISYDSLFTRLQKGGVIPSERTKEEEIALIENDPVRMAMMKQQAEADAAASAKIEKKNGNSGGTE